MAEDDYDEIDTFGDDDDSIPPNSAVMELIDEEPVSDFTDNEDDMKVFSHDSDDSEELEYDENALSSDSDHLSVEICNNVAWSQHPEPNVRLRRNIVNERHRCLTQMRGRKQPYLICYSQRKLDE
jgi:hypothetical protein